MNTIGQRIARSQWLLVSDIDGTLLDDDRPREDNPRLPELIAFLASQRDRVVFGVASGRLPRSAVEVLRRYGLPDPEIIISAVGTEIYYGPDFWPDEAWERHISHQWNRPLLVELLGDVDGIRMQEEELQTPHKASYYLEEGFTAGTLTAIHQKLLAEKLRATVVLSHHKYLDFLPHRAGKGKALRFLAGRYGVPMQSFLTCGNSGNDAEMLKGDCRGIVVGNCSPELLALRRSKRVYFAEAPLAAGILEGLRHYGLIA